MTRPRHRTVPSCALLLAAGLVAGGVACGGDGARHPGTVTGPDTTDTRPDTQPALAVALAAPNPPQPAIVGDSFAFDASRGDSVFRDPLAGGLRYTVWTPAGSGLAATGARITGVPARPGVLQASITATDTAGRHATHWFRIVVFARGLRVPALPAVPFAYSDATAPLPAHFRSEGPGGPVIAGDNTPADNPITDAGATLGRVLFHDPRLSASDAVSCSSCHLQAFGFGDTARFSMGFAGQRTSRHSMALVDVRFYQRGRMFWDERAATLEEQVLRPIQDPVEMGLSVFDLEAKVALTPYYRPLFRDAFGSDTVTAERIARALAQYVRSIVSGSTRFDSAFGGGTTADFARVLTEEERLGRDLFNVDGRCSSCHVTHAQVVIGPANNGLDVVAVDTGLGRGRFKAPSLRHVAVRGRYMHDGRFTSLEQVVDFYSDGVQTSLDLDTRMRGPDGRAQRLGFSPAQKAALVAYLRTLTDPVLLTAEKYADPFR